MKFAALLLFFLMLTKYCLPAKGQSVSLAFVSSLNNTFKENLKAGAMISQINFATEKSIFNSLSATVTGGLYLANNIIILKEQFLNKIINDENIQFNVLLKNQKKIIAEESFTILNNRFHQNKVIAHRGAWKTKGLPQNSVASLKEAIALGCAGSETDVHLTEDSALVINHDPVYAGLPVQKSTLQELRKAKLSNGESLPLLDDFLSVITQQKGTKLILEIKPSEKGRQWANATVEKVITLVHKMQAQAWMVYISFDYEIGKEILGLEPSANVQYLNGDKSPEQLKKDGIKGADYHFSIFQKHPEWIQSAKENNIDLNAWTVNDAKDMGWLLANDFDFITTNEPELLFKEIEKSPTAKGWKLKWSDEFNYYGLPDSSKWNYDTGGNGWGNNEKQYYTQSDSSNAVVKDGSLFIIAKKRNNDENEYTSARLLTRGKADWKYGRIEMSVKLPAGRGLWPAFWMLGKNIQTVGWPQSGEIDIMEHVGYMKDTVLGTVHTGAYNHVKGTQRGKEILIANPYTQFHNFAIEWSPERIDFLLDDSVYYHFANEHKTTQEWPFDQPFFIILNMAVGGNLGGKKGIDEAAFPAVYEVDYVRVYQKE